MQIWKTWRIVVGLRIRTRFQLGSFEKSKLFFPYSAKPFLHTFNFYTYNFHIVEMGFCTVHGPSLDYKSLFFVLNSMKMWNNVINRTIVGTSSFSNLLIPLIIIIVFLAHWRWCWRWWTISFQSRFLPWRLPSYAIYWM